jgi:hypothetical protein
MPKVPLSTITSGYGTVDALNANFNAIEAAFDNTLSRDGETPNQMSANLDMNGNALLNVGTINGAPVTALSDISGYVNTALAAATSASASATSAANTYDQFDDRYLGAKTSNPTLDNDGNALQVGAEYWNSVSNERRTWTGSAWVSSVTVVPDNSVTTSKLVDGSVTTAKLADGSVTPIKLSTGAPTWDTSGNLQVTASTGAIGYGTGAGGTVTQTTSKSTAVTLNRPTGLIVMNNASLAAGASVTFDVNNSLLFGNWLVLVSTAYVNYRVSVDSVSGNKFVVRVTNSNVIPLADDVNVKFALIRVSNT